MRLANALDKTWTGLSGEVYTMRERIENDYYALAVMEKVHVIKLDSDEWNRLSQTEQDVIKEKNAKGKFEYRLHVRGDGRRYTEVNKSIYDYFVGMLDVPPVKTVDPEEEKSIAYTKCLRRIFDSNLLFKSLVTNTNVQTGR